MNTRGCIIVGAAVLFAVESFGALKLGAPFADGVVLQRDRKVPVWGWADAGETVCVSFAGQSKKAVALADGKWRVDLDPMPASKEGRVMRVEVQEIKRSKVKGQEEGQRSKVKGQTKDDHHCLTSDLGPLTSSTTSNLRPLTSSSNPSSLDPLNPSTLGIVIKDVLVGEVWYVSGQSNAECPLWNNIKDGNNPRFRDGNGALVAQMTYRPYVRMCYASDYKTSDTPREEAPFAVKWEPFTPESLGLGEGHGFSAIGAYYALELYAALDVPIGIVGSYWGGTRIEPWIPAEGFDAVASGEKGESGVGEGNREEGIGNRCGIENPSPSLITHHSSLVTKDAHQQPSRLWNEMVNPFAPMAMRGMIWYQGCSNSGDDPARYLTLMHALYKGWSAKFENDAMRLYFVQLAPWGGGGHPEFQQAQADFAAQEPNAAIVVINDLGNLTDIHPNQKESVARRLVVHALKRDYGFDAIEDDSPTLRSYRVEGDRFVLTFDHAKSFYVYNERYCSQDNGFEICGADGVWKKGKIHNFIRHGKDGSYRGGIAGGNVLEVSADGVAEPKKLRYLYSRPWKGTLYNEVCLPLGAFTADVSEQVRRVWCEADGLARMTFTFRSHVVTTFEVEVNGVWAGSVAVPPLSPKEGVSVPFDAPFKKGLNHVRIYGEQLPEIIGFKTETPVNTAGLETEKWQRRIDEAAARGGGRVTIPAGRHVVGGLELRSNVELHLEKGAVLEGAYGLENYRIWSLPCSEGTWSAIIAGVGVTNVAITGEGEIYGNGGAWPLPAYTHANQEGLRARGIFLADAKDVRLEDFLLRDAACWGIVFKCVDGLVARRVRIDNHSNYNNDGFDIEARNAVFDSCDVDASDDAFVLKSNNARFVVENILITNCISRSHCYAYKFGTASHGTMRHVKFVDSKALSPRRDFVRTTDKGPDHGVKGKGFWCKRMGYDRYPAGCGGGSLAVECVDGGAVEDVLFENIEVSGATVPLFVRGGTRKGRHNGVPPGNQYRLRDITFRNIRGEAAGWVASSISGVDGCRAENITLENVDILCRGAGEAASMDALRRPVPNVAGGYPGAQMFGHILPAYGLYVDRTDNLVLRNVTFRLAEGEVDLRPPIAWEEECSEKLKVKSEKLRSRRDQEVKRSRDQEVNSSNPSSLDPLNSSTLQRSSLIAALVPKPMRVEAWEGRCKAWRAASPKIVTAAVEGAPAETADEAYRIEVTPDGVTVTAPTARGVCWAKATLGQLHKLHGGGAWIPCCTITDWPRYPWRGWMVDAGRNFVDVKDLKQLIDHMADYKMNLFHWHLTEYYGWRLESKTHPELQKPESFYLRDIGKYYTQEEFKEIVDYAFARGVTVMPEFDVPGHALAFRRAFGFKTMRDEGVREKLCDLIDELCALVPAEKMPIIHLGSDEARLPEEKVPEKWMQPLVDRVVANGRQVSGWVPGELKHCDLKGKGIAMRWARPTAQELAETKTAAAFDGGGYYVETFDPFELLAVATYRQTCGWDAADNAHAGVIACCWHDERAGSSRGVITEQAMMPAITLLSDAFWCGRDKDEKGFHRRLPLAGDVRLDDAIELERRVKAQRDLVYPKSGRDYPFPFLAQTDMRWRVTVDGEVMATNVAQATVFVWQSNAAGVEGAGSDYGAKGGCFTAKRKGTAVIETWIRSPKTQKVGAWIGFTAYVRDHGRAISGGTPERGKWGRYDPTVELNGERIEAPMLKSAGQKPGGDVEHLLYVKELDEQPYSDEEYYMREPMPIVLKEGWNHVKLTVPCRWCGNQAPWVATFVPLLGTTEWPLEVPGLEYRSEEP